MYIDIVHKLSVAPILFSCTALTQLFLGDVCCILQRAVAVMEAPQGNVCSFTLELCCNYISTGKLDRLGPCDIQ